MNAAIMWQDERALISVENQGTKSSYCQIWRKF